MSKNFFEVKNVDFKVGGKTKVANVSFAIENEGDIICLLGPSGIGKTTILRTIAGWEKIERGTIELKGNVLSSNQKNVEPENRNISLAFQENSLFPHYTVEKNILLGADRNKDKKENSIHATVNNASFVGNSYQYILNSNAGKLFVISGETNDIFKVGEEVFLSINDQEVKILND